jgi:hypothetical protein
VLLDEVQPQAEGVHQDDEPHQYQAQGVVRDQEYEYEDSEGREVRCLMFPETGSSMRDRNEDRTHDVCVRERACSTKN